MVATNATKTAVSSAASFYPTRIDLALETRQKVAAMLNGTLAATTDLRTQTKQAHWNVKGKDFYQLHLLFDEMAGELEEYADMVAERVTALAGTAMGTVRLAAKESIIPEYDFDAVGGMEHVAALADRYAVYAKHLREAIDQSDEWGDQDTNDLYVEISRTIDKRLWFLEAHLVG
ncbi:MAG: DNA starvation/stationary phase protection protein Dps [Phormidesmis sp.]